MRFDVRYRTLLTYSELVVESQNEIRACPATDRFQRPYSYDVVVHPRATVYSFLDGWGTPVDAFGIRFPHLAMEVVAEASVETSARPPIIDTVPVEALLAPDFADTHHEYLQSGRHTYGANVAALGVELTHAHTDVIELARAIHQHVHDALRYEPGATHIGIKVDTILADGVGVCQDYAHLAVALCRAAGIPARYVSGYFFTQSDHDGTEVTDGVVAVTVQTHAWFEAAVPGCGWLALDPTNGLAVGERHVKIGHGRDYDDVMPFRGVFLGPAESDVEAKVDIRRQDDTGVDVGGVDYSFATSAEAAVRLARAEEAAQVQQ